MNRPVPTVVQAAALAAAVGFVVHFGALFNGFAYDDWVLIAGDPGIRSLDGLWHRLGEPSWPGAFGAEVGGWRPVTTAVWALTWVVSGGSPMAFHALGMVLHALATAGVVVLLSGFLPVVAAGVGGLIFAVHPVHVEAVANGVGSAEPLAAVFALSAAVLYVRGGRSFGIGRSIAVASLYALAILSKEGVAVLPALLLLLDAVRADRTVLGAWSWIRPRLLVHGLMLGALVLMLAGRTAVVGGATAASYPPGASVLQEIPRVWTVLSIWPHYFRLLLLPAELAADYGPGIIPVAYGWTLNAVVGCVLALLTAGVCAVVWRRGRPLGWSSEALEGDIEAGVIPWLRVPVAGALWAAVALLPVANIVFLGPVFVAERTLYLPSVGIAMAGAWLFEVLRRDRARVAAGALVVVLVAGAVRTATRVPVWTSTDAVMEALLDDFPESGRGWLAFGQRAVRDGRDAEARRAFAIALGQLNSEYKESTEVASHLMAMGRPESARLLLRRAWQDEPSWPTAPGLLASVELTAGRPEAAALAAHAAVEADPTNGSLHYLLAEALSRSGRVDEAVPARLRAIEAGLGEGFRSWFLLARDQSMTGDTLGALAALDSAQARATTDDDRTAARYQRQLLTPSN